MNMMGLAIAGFMRGHASLLDECIHFSFPAPLSVSLLTLLFSLYTGEEWSVENAERQKRATRNGGGGA